MRVSNFTHEPVFVGSLEGGFLVVGSRENSAAHQWVYIARSLVLTDNPEEGKGAKEEEESVVNIESWVQIVGICEISPQAFSSLLFLHHGNGEKTT